MKCPHCVKEFHDEPRVAQFGKDADGDWGVAFRKCPACLRWVIEIVMGHFYKPADGPLRIHEAKVTYLARPKGVSRSPVLLEVPEQYATDYQEACLVLADSAKASAALSRRCLQHILRDIAKVKHGNLANEIQELLDGGKLPSHIAESIDAVRNIGNFAAHPLKSQATGEVFPVEPGEAEWNLDVLEALFDFYFVQPSILKKKRDALNQKLQLAGKPPMK
jgi:hypothetical protein